MSLKTIQLTYLRSALPAGEEGRHNLTRADYWTVAVKSNISLRVSHQSRVKRCPHQATLEPRVSLTRRSRVHYIGKRSRPGETRGRVLTVPTTLTDRAFPTSGNAQDQEKPGGRWLRHLLLYCCASGSYWALTTYLSALSGLCPAYLRSGPTGHRTLAISGRMVQVPWSVDHRRGSQSKYVDLRGFVCELVA